MSTANVIDYTAPPGARPCMRRPGYLILLVVNGIIALVAIPMIVISAVAGGYGMLGAIILDLGLLGLNLIASIATIIYSVKQSKALPVRTGRPHTWLFVASGAATATSSTALAVLCVVPHAAAC